MEYMAVRLVCVGTCRACLTLRDPPVEAFHSNRNKILPWLTSSLPTVEWADEQPPSASFLRILYLGRILTDESLLSSLNIPQFTPSSKPNALPDQDPLSAGNPESSSSELPMPTVFHVSVRSFAPPSSDDDMKKKGRRRRGVSASAAIPSSVGGTAGDSSNRDGENTGSGGCCGCIIC